MSWTAIFIFAVFAAPFVGSFLGTLVLRLPERRPIAMGRSACEHCGAALGWRDLIPFASWLALRGRCRHCGAPLSAFYPLVEAAALLIVLQAGATTTGWVLLSSILFGWWLLVLAAIDWRTFTLPDVLTLPLAIAGFGAAYAFDRDALLDHAIGAAAGLAAFALIAFLYKSIRGRDGLGFGDAKLLAALGGWVAWQGLATVVLYAAIAGLAVTLGGGLAGTRMALQTRIPFGAYLALGGWLVWLYGPMVVTSL
jgi:leader peptidase (prepilin peptidase)/N-methyltransferase